MLILQADGIQLTLVMLTTSIQEQSLSFDTLAFYILAEQVSN
jgi:hypothetical protein